MMEARQHGIIATALGLIITGTWVVGSALNVPLPTFNQAWPGILIIIGMLLLFQHFSQSTNQAGLAFVALATMFSGMFLCVFTLQIGRLGWRDIIRYWPLILVLVGEALILANVFSRFSAKGVLIPAYLIGGAGLLLLPFTLGIFPGPILFQVIQLSPLPVILALLVMFFRPR